MLVQLVCLGVAILMMILVGHGDAQSTANTGLGVALALQVLASVCVAFILRQDIARHAARPAQTMRV
jgi:hypothetical protein